MYEREDVAAGYAGDRPAVHGRIIAGLGLPRVRAALDVGCGAGLSAVAIAHLADLVVCVEIEPNMLRYRLPGPRYVVGSGERLPFRDGAFGLITASGSLNYMDKGVALREARRVLAPDGVLVVCDFGTGWPDGVEPLWVEDPDPDYPMDPRELPWGASGLRLVSFVERQVRVGMSLDGYARYLRTEGGEQAEQWARETLPTVFDGSSLDVIFDTYGACALHDSQVIAC
ncbi:class I SAM-dependent methyltransferase [Allorhizocola rhizosphaerae]|uniref:class I SAM-dependent methyltransferase n=1 Tax=Allorhizocola rhizosphaerae TaxID=1872709 RepID=UPI0013C2FDEA|nr:class I SAM-dependent methyltransferase [Allorhizocola rhizosphaerae]